MALKRCTQPYALNHKGEAFVITPGMLLDEKDPRFRQEAGAFESVDTYAARMSAPVEEATAAPGERRTRTQPTAKQAAAKKAASKDKE